MNKSTENSIVQHPLAVSIVVWRAADPLFPLVDDLFRQPTAGNSNHFPEIIVNISHSKKGAE